MTTTIDADLGMSPTDDPERSPAIGQLRLADSFDVPSRSRSDDGRRSTQGRSWRLDDETVAAGRRGVAAARAALTKADRSEAA